VFESLFSGGLLLLGMALGWGFARRGGSVSGARADSRASALEGLTSLASDNPDDAVAALSRAVEAEPQTVGLQLTLGNLFRKRGEIDQAIRVHESVVARGNLLPGESDAARLELGRDYLKAGLVDRAEGLLVSLADSSSQPLEVLDVLLELQELTQDWKAAIRTAARIQTISGRSAARRIAQYRCQLAEAARDTGDLEEAKRLARAALAEDHHCLRANLLLGGLDEAQQQWSSATDHYLHALEQNPRFAADIVEPVRRCYAAAGDEAGYAQFLSDAARTMPASPAIAGLQSRWLREHAQDPRAFLAEQVGQKPTRETLLLWLEAVEEVRDETEDLRKRLDRSIKNRPRYVCTDCGLKPSLMFWQCPSCKHWATVMPVEEVL